MKDTTLTLLCLGLILSASLLGCDGQPDDAELTPDMVGALDGNDRNDVASEAGHGAVGHDIVASGVQAPPSDYAAPSRGTRDSVGVIDATPAPDAASRNLRRMTIPQLRDAIRTATGGLYWADNNGNDILLGLEPSLGVPNYIDTTAEEIEPSLVFQKFLGDAARAVCSESIQNDIDMAAADRVMLRRVDPQLSWERADVAQQAAIDETLRDMKLRITGHYAAEGSDDIRRLQWLFRSVTTATGEPARGWRAVCVALMTSPEFYLY